MRIHGRCNTCKRTFLLSQIGPESDAPGRCPFCGARFARHYQGALTDAVAEAEVASARFSAALDRLHSMETGFDIDREGFLHQLSEQMQPSQTSAQ